MKITSSVFNLIFSEALNSTEEKEIFVSDWALSSVFSEDSDPEKTAEAVSAIYDAAKMSVKEIRQAAGMTVKNIAQYFCIPVRTWENWESLKVSNHCPNYIRLMMIDTLQLINLPERR